VIAMSAGGGVSVMIIYLLVSYCIKKKIHTKCKSACCETELDVIDATQTTPKPNT
jgi:hypothetical protein